MACAPCPISSAAQAPGSNWGRDYPLSAVVENRVRGSWEWTHARTMPEDILLDCTPSLAARALELIRRDLLIALAALFAVVWICHRAWVQSRLRRKAPTELLAGRVV